MPKRVMTGAEALELRRKRMAEAPAFLRGGFRPFFLGAALWAIATLAIWLFALANGSSPVSHFDALSRHRHEMLFGFVGAAVAGFILTAVPNWTGRLPIAGWPLGLLAMNWLVARLLPLTGVGSPLLWALLDAGFYFVLAVLILREVLLAGNRNLPIALLILLFGIADGADLAAGAGLLGEPELAIRLGLAIVVMMISLIGGRITPSFTRNWLAKHGVRENMPTQPGRFDALVLLASAMALAAFVIWPEAHPAGWALIAAGALQAVRLFRWQGLSAISDPLVFILHVGYAWLPVGLVLLGLSIIGTEVPRTAAIHALTAGAMATMILAVMSRATLGHTGRELKAGSLTILAYGMITLAAVARVASSLSWGDPQFLLHLSGGAWISAFALFVIIYGPMLLNERADGRP